MARKRLSDGDWDLVRIDIEVYSMSRTSIAKKYGIGTTTVTDKVIKEGWLKGSAAELVNEKVDIIKNILSEKSTTIRQPTDKNRQKTDKQEISQVSRQYNQAVNDLVVANFATDFFKKLEDLDFINTAMDKTHNLMQLATKPEEVKTSVDTAIKTGQLAGALPLFGSSSVNVNTQQNVQVEQTMGDDELDRIIEGG